MLPKPVPTVHPQNLFFAGWQPTGNNWTYVVGLPGGHPSPLPAASTIPSAQPLEPMVTEAADGGVENTGIIVVQIHPPRVEPLRLHRRDRRAAGAEDMCSPFAAVPPSVAVLPPTGGGRHDGVQEHRRTVLRRRHVVHPGAN